MCGDGFHNLPPYPSLRRTRILRGSIGFDPSGFHGLRVRKHLKGGSRGALLAPAARHTAISGVWSLVYRRGLEPLTAGLKIPCATNCANGTY